MMNSNGMNMNMNYLLCILAAVSCFDNAATHPDEKLSVSEIIRKHNYPVEEHTIPTQDGYLLTTFRIPHGLNNEAAPKKVVLLAHGLASSADDWVTVGPDSIAYLLANDNYDVWLFNARGTKHSRKHLKLDPDRDAKEFWNFCWEEIGLYDLPANVNYILNYTKAAKLFYVGHSQGGTSNLIMLSQYPEMNSKIIVEALLAPAVYFENVKDSMVLKIVMFLFPPKARSDFYEFPPKTPFYNNQLSRQLCSHPSLVSFCYNSLYFGEQLENHPIDPDLVPVIAEHAPNSFSTKQIHHYNQIMQSGEFKRYDYGRSRNMNLYGTVKPPLYSISNITVPMIIFYGSGDFLATSASVKRLSGDLKNQHTVFEVPFEGFSHIDFLWAKNAKQLIYDRVLDTFRKYSN